MYARRESRPAKAGSVPSDEDVEDAEAPSADGTEANGPGDAGSRHAA